MTNDYENKGSRGTWSHGQQSAMSTERSGGHTPIWMIQPSTIAAPHIIYQRKPRVSSLMCVAHLCPVAVCWQWSTWLSSISSELSERNGASATSPSPSICLAEAPRRWHRPAGHHPLYHPPGQEEGGDKMRRFYDEADYMKTISLWSPHNNFRQSSNFVIITYFFFYFSSIDVWKL